MLCKGSLISPEQAELSQGDTSFVGGEALFKALLKVAKNI